MQGLLRKKKRQENLIRRHIMEISKKQMEEMDRNAYIAMVHEILDRELNSCSGTKQAFTMPEEGSYFCKVVDIRWKGNIHFEAEAAKGNGWYFVSRDNQKISNLYHFYKINDRTVTDMQQLINDIESGRYNRKKTLSEQIRAIVEERGLTGYMNATKWKELLDGIGTGLRKLSIMYKTLFDENEPDVFWSLAGDEYIEYINTAVIEWMKINPVSVERERQGILLDDKVQVRSLESELIALLKKYHIPYEYVESEKVYIIYGYK